MINIVKLELKEYYNGAGFIEYGYEDVFADLLDASGQALLILGLYLLLWELYLFMIIYQRSSVRKKLLLRRYVKKNF